MHLMMGETRVRSHQGFWARRGLTIALTACLVCLVASGQALAGLVGYWPLDGNGTAVVGDSGTVNGAAAAADRLGNPSGALAFNGTSNYVQVPHSAPIGANVRDTLTLSMWIRPGVNLSTTADTYRALEKGDSYFFIQGNGTNLGTGGQNFVIKQSDTVRAVSLNEALSANTWYHLAATYTRTTGEMCIYLDGGLKNTFIAPAAQIDNDGLPLRIGSDDAGKWFNGRIDDVAIYDHVLQPYEILALARGTAAPNSLPAAPAPLITGVTRTGGVDPIAPIVSTAALAQNALAYADRVHVWDSFPSAHPELVGSDYIRIANDDRDAANLRLNVGLARPSTVYLFRDSRLTGTVLTNMNQWMTAYGFKGTGESVWLDENGDGSANTRFDVFRGNFPTGSVDLFAQNTPGANAIYGVAAVEQLALPSAHAYTPFGTGKTSLEQSGQVVVEAENYTSRTLVAGGTDGWFVVPTERAPAGPLVSNARGGEYIQSLPDDQSAGGATVPPSISYDVVISTPGQYRLYLRWDGNNTNSTTQGQSDSIFVDIAQFKDGTGGAHADWYELSQTINGNFDNWDGTGQAEVDVAGPADNAIVWNVSTPGTYTVRVSQREDGANVDALVFQLNSLTAPTNPGPAPSDFSNGVPLAAGWSKLGGDYDAIHPLGVTGGLVEGARAYVDAAGAWTNIPPELLGADYIRTENHDAGYGFVDYSILAGQTGFLYLFLDDRYLAAHGMPGWMLDLTCLDTSLDVLLDGTQPFSIFQLPSPVASGDAVSLGALFDASMNFYGIAFANVSLVLIPEPGTLSLLGLGALALLRRRRRAAG